MASLGYACLGTNDFPRALDFYDAVIGAMGGRRWKPGPVGWIYLLEGSAFMLVRPQDGQPARPGNGTMLAFRMAADEVPRLHALALSLGATDEGAPGPRGDWGTFAYVRDLDGNKLAFYNAERKSE